MLETNKKERRSFLLEEIARVIGISGKETSKVALSKAQTARVWEILSREKVDAVWIDWTLPDFREKILDVLGRSEEDPALPLSKSTLAIILEKIEGRSYEA